MNNNGSSSKGFELNIVRFLVELSKRLWIGVIIALILGIIGGVVAKFTREKTYSSNITFIVNTVSEGQFAASSDVTAQINMSQTFQNILESRTLKLAVREASDEKYTYGMINESIVVSVIPNTNIIELNVTTENPEASFEIASKIVEVYGDIVERVYPTARLMICDKPVKASSPDARYSSVAIAIIAAFVGMAGFCIVELVMFIAKDTVKTSDELNEKLNVPILGSVQLVENKNKTQKGLLIVDRKTGFSFIETYKAIRTKIENNAARTGNKVYLVTSACENEGKTTVSANIALSLAENGKRVLLIDADLRKPSVAKILALPKTDVGFIDVIKGEAELGSAIKLIQSFNLYILTDQNTTNTPSELLSRKITEDIINGLRDDFDYIIIDTAPASVVTDAVIIAGFADAAIMVVREDYSPFSRIREAVEDIDQNGAEIVGCVFNAASNSAIRTRRYGKYKRYGYGKYGKYGYGKYGYGYGESGKK